MEVLGCFVVVIWVVKEVFGYVKVVLNFFFVDEVKGFVIGDVLL